MSTVITASTPADVIESVLALKHQHAATWWNKSDAYWLAGLAEEVLELTAALEGKHEHSPEVELTQIAAIALNWLELRLTRSIMTPLTDKESP